MRRPRCHDCAQRLTPHDFHLCPERHKPYLLPEEPGHKASLIERSDRTHHAAILREAEWSWDDIEALIGVPKGVLQVAVHRRGYHHRRAA